MKSLILTIRTKSTVIRSLFSIFILLFTLPNCKDKDISMEELEIKQQKSINALMGNAFIEMGAALASVNHIYDCNAQFALSAQKMNNLLEAIDKEKYPRLHVQTEEIAADLNSLSQLTKPTINEEQWEQISNAILDLGSDLFALGLNSNDESTNKLSEIFDSMKMVKMAAQLLSKSMSANGFLESFADSYEGVIEDVINSENVNPDTFNTFSFDYPIDLPYAGTVENMNDADILRNIQLKNWFKNSAMSRRGVISIISEFSFNYHLALLGTRLTELGSILVDISDTGFSNMDCADICDKDDKEVVIEKVVIGTDAYLNPEEIAFIKYALVLTVDFGIKEEPDLVNLGTAELIDDILLVMDAKTDWASSNLTATVYVKILCQNCKETYCHLFWTMNQWDTSISSWELIKSPIGYGGLDRNNWFGLNKWDDDIKEKMSEELENTVNGFCK